MTSEKWGWGCVIGTTLLGGETRRAGDKRTINRPKHTPAWDIGMASKYATTRTHERVGRHINPVGGRGPRSDRAVQRSTGQK